MRSKTNNTNPNLLPVTLHRYRDLDLHIQKNKERLIDGLVKAIYLYDDKLVFYLTYTDDPVTIPSAEELEAMEHSSDVNALSSPKKEDTLEGVFFFCRTARLWEKENHRIFKNFSFAYSFFLPLAV